MNEQGYQGHNHHDHHDHGHPHHYAWRWAVAIIIVFAAFGVGFMCGRFSALFGGYGYGYPMGPWMMYGGYGYGYPAGYAVPQTQAVPANGTTTPDQYYYPMYRMMGGYYYPQATGTQ